MMVEGPKKLVKWASTIKITIGEDQEKKEENDDNNNTSIEMEETAAATSTIPAMQRNSFGQSFCDKRPKEVLQQTVEGNIIIGKITSLSFISLKKSYFFLYFFQFKSSAPSSRSQEQSPGARRRRPRT